VILNATRTITVNSGAFQPELTIHGNIADGTGASGVLKNGTGTLFLSGSNIYTGTTTVDKGIVTMNSGARAIPGNVVIGNAVDAANSAIVRELLVSDLSPAASFTINASGTLDMNGGVDAIGALTGVGNVKLPGVSSLSVCNDNSTSTFDGLISGGSGAIIKNGTGVFTLTNANTYTGPTTITKGTMQINGAQPSSAVAVTTGGTLAGTGTSGAVTSVASKVSPGVSGIGTLSEGALSLDATSSFNVDIASAAVDTLAVTGTVTLGSSTLNVTPAPSFSAVKGSKFTLIVNDAADAVSGTFKGLPEGSVIPVGTQMLSISYVGGTGNDVVLTGVNVAPTVASAALAIPNPAGVGQTVSFIAAGADVNLDTLTYAWAYGDGTGSPASASAAATHAYAAAGMYTATVTIDDGQGGVVISSVLVVVNAPIVGEGKDSDGDGFSDDFETAAGTSPTDATSTPTGAAATAPLALTISKIGITLNFAKAASDGITLSGTLPVPAGFSVAGKQVSLDIGGVPKAFTLTSKGMGLDASKNSFKIGIKASKGVVLAQTSKYSLKISKGTFAASFKDEGLVGTADDKGSPHKVVVTVVFNKMIFQKTQSVTFKAKKGKVGAAKGP
jgi:autotransporter-associated beta strand protein